MKRFLTLCVTLAMLLPALSLAAAKITEAKLGKGVADRTITGETSVFAPGERAYLWLRVDEAAGETLTVNWKVNDQVYPATLSIGGSPWRTWASKTVHIAGEWTVTVTDAAGTALSETKFTVK